MTINAPASPLRAGTELELAFNDLLANGQAVGRAGGAVVFCFGPLPGERARVRVRAVKPRYAVAELLEVTASSSFRATPFCPVFGTCGGCQVQHLSYPAQLTWKSSVVRNALERIGGFRGVRVRDTIGATDPRAYRNKMSLVVERRSGGPRLGFYQQRSHELVPIDECPILMPALNAALRALNEARAQENATPLFAGARHFVARAARTTCESVLTVTTAHRDDGVARVAPELLERIPGAVGITNSYDLSSQNAIMGRKHSLVAGRAQIEERIAGVRYRVSAGSFFQINVEIVGRIFEFIAPGLRESQRIVDLYCGAGTFAVYFAHLGCEVLGVEESAQAVAEARENADLNGLSRRARFLAGRVEERVRKAEVRAALRAARIVFLDPPRKGSDEATLAAIAAAGVGNVWYLSCDPATLARDLKFLRAKGYRLGAVQPFDMFPQTGHVETFVTLYRGDAKVAEAFKDVAEPAWPKEYPEFVVR